MRRSTSKHDILQDISKGIAGGRFENCVHLDVVEPGDFNRRHICCKESSFAYSKDYRGLDEKPYCPKGCLLFRIREQVDLEAERHQHRQEWKERFKLCRVWAGRVVSLPFQWFSALPWQTQTAILLLLILLVSPKWVPQLIELVKAFGT